jgi:hypothetical protein
MGSILSCNITKLRFFVSSLALNFQWSLSAEEAPVPGPVVLAAATIALRDDKTIFALRR